MTLFPGTRLGPYEIVGQIGAGGMGEVWKARDTRLGREVAIKLLPSAFGESKDRLRRFEHEAKALAAISHPNILAVFDVGTYEGSPYLVIEFLEGGTLRERLSEGALSVKQTVELALQMARGLVAAHSKGLVHRDLKPANLFITRDGLLKILDFGLAKQATGTAGDQSQLPTVDGQNLTSEGLALGTVGYMSPEQVTGKPADARSDIFSFGVVLYEMLSGHRAFERGSAFETLSATLKDEPPELGSPTRPIPQALQHIVMRCLAKDPAERYQSALDLCQELDILPNQVVAGARFANVARAITLHAVRRIPRNLWIPLVLLVVAGLVLNLWRGLEPAQLQATFTPLTMSGAEQFPSLSPDGKWIVYSGLSSGHRHIFLQSVGGQTPFPLTKDTTADDDEPTFSRDGERIAFWSSRGGGGLWVMGRTGEDARRVTSTGFNPSWSPDGRQLVYATENVQLTPLNQEFHSELHIVDVGSGVSHLLHSGNAVQPSWSPHNRRIAYVARSAKGLQLDICTLPVGGGEAVAVTSDAAADWSPAWSQDGEYLYFASNRGGTMNLWRVRIDEDSGKPLSKPVPITTPAQFVAHPSISADGRLIAYCGVSEKQNIQRVAFDPSLGSVTGEPEWVTFGLRPWSSPDVSPDGRWLAFYSRTQPEGHLYVQRADGTEQPRRLTEDAIDRVPRWSPDGNRIVTFSDRNKSIQLWAIRPDGSGLTQLTDGDTFGVAVWKEDGSRIAVSTVVGPMSPGNCRTYVFDPTQPWDRQSPQILPPPEASLFPFIAMTWSPDGEKLVGQIGWKDRRAAGFVVYYFKTGKYERLTDYGEWPVWLKDGRRLLCVSKGQEFIIVDTQSKKAKTVFSVTRDVLGPPRLPRDQNYIFYSRRITESGISLVALR